MLWLAVGHSVSAVPLQCPFCQHHPFLSQVSQPPPLFLLPTNRLPRRVGMPLCILPPHLVRLPRPLCLLGSPLCCPALLPEKLFPRPLCLLGQPLCCPALLPEKLFCAFWVCPCAAQCSPCGCLSFGPCVWWVCPCAPRRSSGRSFLSRSYFGHTDPSTLCPAFNRALPCQ